MNTGHLIRDIPVRLPPGKVRHSSATHLLGNLQSIVLGRPDDSFRNEVEIAQGEPSAAVELFPVDVLRLFLWCNGL